MEVSSDYRTRQRKDNSLPTHLSSAMLSRPSNLPPGYIRVERGRNAGPLGHLASPPARARGLLARPARPPEGGGLVAQLASWPPREHATLRKRISVFVSSGSILP